MPILTDPFFEIAVAYTLGVGILIYFISVDATALAQHFLECEFHQLRF